MEEGILVNVAVRVRPLLSNQGTNVVKYIHEPEEPPVLVISDKRNVYAFDQIFSENASQCEVYNIMLKSLVSKVLSGFNCTVLAYGQTGTGKTFTMGSDSQNFRDSDAGLIPRVLEELFEISSIDPTLSLSVSFIEIYNEKVYDLLTSTKTTLTVKGFNIIGMSCVSVESEKDVRHWLLVGSKGRHVRHTALNASSSRSHAVFTVYCKKKDSGVVSKLHLVDLAGSESVRRTGNQGRAFQEGVTINRGLLAVGRVVKALSDRRSLVIPYRDSMLTTILHDSLNIDNFVSLLACVSPSETDVLETLATLRFASTAKTVRSRPLLKNIVATFDRIHPGVLASPAPFTSIKKKKRRLELFTSTEIKRPPLKEVNSFAAVAESPTYTTTMDSLSMSTSTMIDTVQPTFALSPIVRRCTQVLQQSVTEQVNVALKERLVPTPAPINDEMHKKNTHPLVVNWSAVETKVTEIIRNELSRITLGDVSQNHTRRNSSPLSKRQLQFDECNPLVSTLNKSKTPDLPKDEDIFKVPTGLPVSKQRVRSSVSVRRSTRLSLKRSPATVPTPAPRCITNMKSHLVESLPVSPAMKTTSASTAFKPTRRSVRLSLKCLSPPPMVPTPLPRYSFRNDTSSPMNKPTPAPRKLATVQQKKKSPLKMVEEKWKTPKKTTSPWRKHQQKIFRILNYGTQKDLQTLATIGVKTALQIHTFRTLNGVFNSFEDLKKIPTWQEKKYERFMTSNQLT